MYEKILFQLIENKEEKEFLKPNLCLLNINKINFNYYLNSNNNYSLKTYINLWIKNIIIFLKLNNNKNFYINIIGNLNDENGDKNIFYDIIIDESNYFIKYDEFIIDNKNNELLFEKMIKIKNIDNYELYKICDNGDNIDLLKDFFTFDF